MNQLPFFLLLLFFSFLAVFVALLGFSFAFPFSPRRTTSSLSSLPSSPLRLTLSSVSVSASRSCALGTPFSPPRSNGKGLFNEASHTARPLATTTATTTAYFRCPCSCCRIRTLGREEEGLCAFCFFFFLPFLLLLLFFFCFLPLSLSLFLFLCDNQCPSRVPPF